MCEPLVERLHKFFVRVFTTNDLFDKDKRQEMRIESLALDDEVAKLEAALTLIGDIAYDCDGYTGSASKLGELVNEIYGYARNPQTAVDALADIQEKGDGGFQEIGGQRFENSDTQESGK